MIKIISTGTCGSIELYGTIEDVTAEFCCVIKSIYDKIAQSYDVDKAEGFISGFRKFIDRYNFALSTDENIKRQEQLHHAIEGLNEIIKKCTK